MNELIETYKSYIQLLSDELNELVGMAAVHGWKSSRHEEGVKLRAEIERLSSIGGEEKTLDLFINEIKSEFHNQNWDYLDFIKDRVLSKLNVTSETPVKKGEPNTEEDLGKR